MTASIHKLTTINPETCVFCGTPISEDIPLDAHNPWPVKDEGRCCFLCNSEIVSPARLSLYATVAWLEAQGVRLYYEESSSD